MVKYRNCKDIYIGPLIQKKVDERRIPYAEFARKIRCARTSLYHIFESKSIDIDRLLLISEVLEYDFIQEIYMKDHQEASPFDHPFIALPIRNGEVVLEDLPQQIKEQFQRLME